MECPSPIYGPEAPVPIFQHEYEFSRLLDLYRRRTIRRVLEIGSYHGGTLYHWAINAHPGTVIVSVDTYTAADNRSLYPDWGSDVEIVAIQGDSRDPDVIRRVKELGPYDWVFIDAGHEYDEVKADWDNYRPFAAPGSVICFHDILPASEQQPNIHVDQLWAEIKSDGGWTTEEIIWNEHAPWGGIGIVHVPAPRHNRRQPTRKPTEAR